jgi:antitoxin ParD1/3/4
MNVSLTPQLEEMVNKKVASGRYNSASEVVREALRLLEDQDRLREMRIAELRKEIAIGLEQLDRGEYVEYDEASLKRRFDEIKAEGRKRLANRRKGGR